MKDMLRLHMLDTNYLDDGDSLEYIVAESRRGYRTSSLEERTLNYAVEAINLYRRLYKLEPAAKRLANQFLDSATSIGANVAEGQAAVSRNDFAHKYSIARKEARECLFWLSLFEKSKLVSSEQIRDIKTETDELIAILTTIVKKVKPRDT